MNEQKQEENAGSHTFRGHREASVCPAHECIHACPHVDLSLHSSAIPIERERSQLSACTLRILSVFFFGLVFIFLFSKSGLSSLLTCVRMCALVIQWKRHDGGGERKGVSMCLSRLSDSNLADCSTAESCGVKSGRRRRRTVVLCVCACVCRGDGGGGVSCHKQEQWRPPLPRNKQTNKQNKILWDTAIKTVRPVLHAIAFCSRQQCNNSQRSAKHATHSHHALPSLTGVLDVSLQTKERLAVV